MDGWCSGGVGVVRGISWLEVEVGAGVRVASMHVNT